MQQQSIRKQKKWNSAFVAAFLLHSFDVHWSHILLLLLLDILYPVSLRLCILRVRVDQKEKMRIRKSVNIKKQKMRREVL